MADSHAGGEQDLLPTLIELPTSELLVRFGEGGHKPGSGSAAALSGFYAAALTQTVAKLTLKKEQYADLFPVVELVRQQARSIQEQLQQLFQEDAIKFDRVMKLRLARDAEADPASKRVLRDQARAALSDATETPLEIARQCISLAEKALYLFDHGYKAVRGD
jgi:formiminotetrahydrofolate cyclodeaminase